MRTNTIRHIVTGNAFFSFMKQFLAICKFPPYPIWTSGEIGNPVYPGRKNFNEIKLMILGHITLLLTKCHRSESDSRVNIPKQSKMGSTVNYVFSQNTF